MQILFRLESARNVRAADTMGTSDPFVKVSAGFLLGLASLAMEVIRGKIPAAVSGKGSFCQLYMASK